MDTELKNGDYSTDIYGRLVEIGGKKQLEQSLMICLCVPKGAFVYNRTLGSRLKKMKGASDDEIRGEILSAAEGIIGAELDEFSADDTGLTVIFDSNEEKIEITVAFENEETEDEA